MFPKSNLLFVNIHIIVDIVMVSGIQNIRYLNPKLTDQQKPSNQPGARVL
jgi:hypothetical protein